MPGLELFSVADVEHKGPLRTGPDSASSCFNDDYDSASASGERPAASLRGQFANRLEAALAAVRADRPSAPGGKPLPVPALEAQSLGESTDLITEAGAEPTTDEALYLLALAQGLEPEVVAGVLWPGGQGSRPPGIEAGNGAFVGRSTICQDLNLGGAIDSEFAAVDGEGSDRSRAPEGLQVGVPWILTPTSPPKFFGQGEDGGLNRAIGLTGGATPLVSDPVTGVSVTPSAQLAPGSLSGESVEGLSTRPRPQIQSDLSSLGFAQDPEVPFDDGGVRGISLAQTSVASLKSAVQVSVPGAEQEIDAGPKVPAPQLGQSSQLLQGVQSGQGGQTSMLAASLNHQVQGDAATGASQSGQPALSSSLGPPSPLGSSFSVAVGGRFTIASTPAAHHRERGAGGAGGADVEAGESDQADGLFRGASALSASLPAADWIHRHFRLDQAVSGSSSPALTSGDGAAAMAPDSQATQGLAEISSSVGTELAGSPSAARSNSVDLSVALAELERSSGDESDRDALRARVSEAFASRMVAQVGRGHWSMLLELKPADLGSVSIEMSMQNGQLEAIFDAPSPAARALLADGLERLRQELEKSGMNVAHLGMQQFAGGSGGGKPTAGRFERKVEPDADEVNSAAETDPSMRASNTASERVLDVRV